MKNNYKIYFDENLICISAPSGSGKTTLCKLVREVRPELIWSVSCTTRNPRKNEKDGEDYNFISIKKFESLIHNGEFAEWENVHGNYYGTLKSYQNSIDKTDSTLNLMLLYSLLKIYIQIILIQFFCSSKYRKSRKRLKHRGSESMHSIEKRLQRFKRNG